MDIFFDIAIDNLPDSITHLTFGNLFNKHVDNLPNSITHLTFGIYFNQLVDNLPNSITYLTLISRYKYFSDIPDNIDKIRIIFYDDDCTINNLPIHIKKIYVDSPDKIKFISKIPFGCEVIKL